MTDFSLAPYECGDCGQYWWDAPGVDDVCPFCEGNDVTECEPVEVE